MSNIGKQKHQLRILGTAIRADEAPIGRSRLPTGRLRASWLHRALGCQADRQPAMSMATKIAVARSWVAPVMVTASLSQRRNTNLVKRPQCPGGGRLQSRACGL